MITSLYKSYFQKSRVFLYPVLGIPRSSSVTPINTYMSWADHYDLNDMKLCCVFHIRDDVEYKQFEKSILFNHDMFHDFFESDEGTGIYVFDYSRYAQDWEIVLEGKYSKLSMDMHEKIGSYYAKYQKDFVYINSFLHPHMHFDIYANILDIPVSVLKDVGELCDKPDIEAETLKVFVKVLDYRTSNT